MHKPYQTILLVEGSPALVPFRVTQSSFYIYAAF